MLSGGLVANTVFDQALRSPAVTFVTDPRIIIEATRASLAFEAEIGDFATAPSIEGLFDTGPYLKATGAAP